jgi:hypothetical protein
MTEGVFFMKIRSLLPAAAAFITLGAAGWFLPQAFAQRMWDMVKVNLPHTVIVGDKTLPPGEYTIEQMEGPYDSPVLMIYNGTGMKFQTSALTITALDPNTPQHSSVTLHHIGDAYYIDKIWVAGKNYGYQIPLPKKVEEQLTEASSESVPAQASTTTSTASTTDTTTTTTNTQPSAPPPPPPVQEPAATTPAATPASTPTAEPQATSDTQQLAPPTTSADDNSANREIPPSDNTTPNMPATSAGWLAMVLSGGTLSSAGLMLRRRKR